MTREVPAGNIGLASELKPLKESPPMARRSLFFRLWLPALIGLFLLTSELYFLLYDLNRANWMSSAGGEKVATLLDRKQDVWNRPAGTVSWGTARVGEVYVREDALATMADSEAIVEFTDGSVLHVEPNSMVVLERAPEAGVPGGKISIRLLRGGVVRRRATRTPFEIVFRGPEGMGSEQRIHIEEAANNSTVEVKTVGTGVQLKVESGAVRVNGTQTVSEKQGAVIRSADIPIQTVPVEKLPPSRLPAPKINRPKVNVEGAYRPSRLVPWIFSLLFSPREVWAGKSSKVTVDLSWESVLGAKVYRLQISDSSDFGQLLFEKDLSEPSYRYVISNPEASPDLFYRVAAIDEAGRVGAFSQSLSIEIPPPVEMRPAPPKEGGSHPVVKKRPKVLPRVAIRERSKEKPRVVNTPPVALRAAPAESVAAKVLPLPTPDIVRYGWQANVGAGPYFHSRSFKNTDVNPKTTSSSGVIPAGFAADLFFLSSRKEAYVAGLELLLESIEPATGAVDVTKSSASVLRLWGGYGKRGLFLQWTVGPYLTTSEKIEFSEVEMKATRRVAVGALIAIGRSLNKGRNLSWHAELAPFLAFNSGGFGADVSGALRFPFRFLNLFDFERDRGLYCEPTLFGRFSAGENAFGGGVRMGYAL